LIGFKHFLQIGPGNRILNRGTVLAATKAGEHVILEFAGAPPFRRVLNWDSLANFAFFVSVADVEKFLQFQEGGAANEESSRPQTPAAAEQLAGAPSQEGPREATAAPAAEADNVVPLEADER
jgi:hypothetical protein